MIRRASRKIGCFILAVLLLTGLAAGCRLDETPTFPALETTKSVKPDPGGETLPKNPEATAPAQLKAALPISQAGLDAARLLFLAKQSGLLNLEPGQTIGLQVQIDDLRQFDDGSTIDLLPVPISTGATVDQIRIWKNADDLPDIIYTLSAADLAGLLPVRNLEQEMYNQPLLSAGHVNIPALASVSLQGSLIGIPWLASTPILVINQQVADKLKLVIPDENWTWDSWLDFFKAAQVALAEAELLASPEILAEFAEDQTALEARLSGALFVMNDPTSILCFLPAAFDAKAAWAAWNGEAFALDHPAFRQAVAWLREGHIADGTVLQLSDEQRQLVFSGQDPDQSGRTLMWLTDSAVFAEQRQNLPPNLLIRLLPSAFSQQEDKGNRQSAPLFLTGRALVVNKQSKAPQMAAQLASFIALDVDALLMQSRFSSDTGQMPLVYHSEAWQALIQNPFSQGLLADFSNRLPDACFSSQQTTANWFKAMQEMFSAFGLSLLGTADDNEIDRVIDAMETTSVAILKGG
ncbi:MAG: extracellular solute-binding protein [Saccharofermentanales bacterium]|jgi:ABC-type glycerol-3-phosphate transport system substrate-binding protein